MKAKNTTIADLENALQVVNQKYQGNIRFKRLEQNGRGVNFTLTVNSSCEPGHRRGFFGFDGKQPKRLAAACWHVHGDFFEALLNIAPDAVVISQGNKIITKQSGNWQDWNIGSQMHPMYYSEACDCEV